MEKPTIIALPLKDQFPDVNPERITNLLANRDFKASTAIAKMMPILAHLPKDGSTGEISLLVSEFYTPAMQALQSKLLEEG